MAKKSKEIVISKEDAVFWLDKNGCWCNKHGEFQHKKIINFFHSSIKKDKEGYYLSQTDGSCTEKVYFHFEDCALFVFDVIKNNEITLILNTKKQVKLKPKKLSIKDDNLYMHIGQEKVKFTQQSLMKIYVLIEYDDDQYFINVKNRKYKITINA